MNALRALAITLESFFIFDNFVYFLLSSRTRLEMDRSLNTNNTINGFEEAKEEDDCHHQVGRRRFGRRKDKASLFRETRSHSSVFRIIVSDLNFKISALVSPKISVLQRFTLLRARAAKEERRSLFHSIIIVIPFILIYTHSHSLSLSDETRTKNAVGIQ